MARAVLAIPRRKQLEPGYSLALLLTPATDLSGRAARGSVDPRKMACLPVAGAFRRFKAIGARSKGTVERRYGI